MSVGILFLSLAAGGASGMYALIAGFGLIKSLVIYAVVGQLTMLAVPVAVLLLEAWRDLGRAVPALTQGHSDDITLP